MMRRVVKGGGERWVTTVSSEVNQKLIQVRTRFDSRMDEDKYTFPLGIANKKTIWKGTHIVLQKLIKI